MNENELSDVVDVSLAMVGEGSATFPILAPSSDGVFCAAGSLRFGAMALPLLIGSQNLGNNRLNTPTNITHLEFHVSRTESKNVMSCYIS